MTKWEREMEFENRYYDTRKTLSHFYGKCVYRLYRWLGVVLLLFGGIQVATVVADIMGFFVEPLNAKTRLIFFDLGIIIMALGILLLCQHLITSGIAYRRMKKMGGGAVPETECRFGEEMSLAIGETKSVYSYTQVQRIVETREEYALMMNRHSGIRARKGDFVQGKEADFAQFLREKCPGTKWKRY